MNKIKNWIKNWLFKEEINLYNHVIKDLHEYIELNKKMEQCNQEIHELNIEMNKRSLKLHNKFIEAEDTVKNIQKLLTKLVDIGVDIHTKPSSNSWAVICIKGKPEYVKFLPFLDAHSTQDIIKFLKQFDYSNKIIDSPFSPTIYDMMEEYKL